MLVSGPLGHGNACGEGGSGLFGASSSGKELSVLVVCRDVIGAGSEDGLEMLIGPGGIACVGALHRQAVPGERIIGFCGDEFFKHLAARFLLWLGHGGTHSIFAVGRNAKSTREPGAHLLLPCGESRRDETT
jgi:hypothetical protein